MTDLQDVAAFILDEATDQDLTYIYDACKTRAAALRTVKAAAVTEGMLTTLAGLAPKYLNGLSGTVTKITGKRCDVILDKESTDRLRYAGRRKFNVPFDAESYRLAGVPLSCAGPQQ